MLREVEAPADEALNHTESEAYCAVGRPVGHSCPRFAAQLGHVVRVCRRRPQLCREPIASWQRSVRAHARDFVLEGVTQSMLSLVITQLLDALPHHAPGSPHAQGARPRVAARALGDSDDSAAASSLQSGDKASTRRLEPGLVNPYMNREESSLDAGDLVTRRRRKSRKAPVLIYYKGGSRRVFRNGAARAPDRLSRSG
jgi:hypothetical protein